MPAPLLIHYRTVTAPRLQAAPLCGALGDTWLGADRPADVTCYACRAELARHP